MKRIIISTALLLAIAFHTPVFSEFSIRNYFRNAQYEVSAIGDFGVRIRDLKTKEELLLHKKKPFDDVYEVGINYANYRPLFFTSAFIVDQKLILSVQSDRSDIKASGIDIVDLRASPLNANKNDGAKLPILYHLPFENVLTMAPVITGDDISLVVLTHAPHLAVCDLHYFSTEHLSRLDKMSTLRLPSSGVYDFALTRSFKLETGAYRSYLILQTLDEKSTLWSIDHSTAEPTLRYIGELSLGSGLRYLHLEKSPRETATAINEDTLLYVSDPPATNVVSYPLRTLLSDAFMARNKRLKEEEERQQQGVQAYATSDRYRYIKTYAAIDSFARDFIPFDDDLIPQLVGYYLMGTSPEKMIENDLQNKKLLEGLTPQEIEQFGLDLKIIRALASDAGLFSIIALPLLKGAQAAKRCCTLRNADRYTKKSLQVVRMRERLSNPAQVVKLRDRLERGLVALTGLERARIEQKISVLAARAERRLIQLAEREALLQPIYQGNILGSMRALLKRSFDGKVLDMFPKVMLVSNLTWGIGEILTQFRDHGWEVKEWNAAQMTYNGVFINTLTGALMIISGVRTHQFWKTVAIIGTIDVLSPLAQKIENRVIRKDPDRPYDPAQATFDKLYLSLFALPKNQLNYFFQPKLVSAAKQSGFSDFFYKWVIPGGMNAVNEMAGNGGYSWTVEKGKEKIKNLLIPVLQVNQQDLESLLRGDIKIQEPPDAPPAASLPAVSSPDDLK